MEPSKLDVFIHSRQAKNGKQVDEFTSQKLANLNEELQKLPETAMIDNAVKDSIHEKIIGPEKPSRMCTYGMGPTFKDIMTSNHMYVAQKQAFDDVNEKIEAMGIQMSAEMDAKLCHFKDDLISYFEERICNFAPLQREMTAPQQSLLRVGDGINNQAEDNDDEVNNQSEKSDSERVIHIVRKQRTKRARKQFIL